MSRYKVSVIIPTYNAANTLEAAIESVLRQTYEPWEILIMDGGSEDDTVSIAEKLKGNNLIVSSSKDRGVYDAMNKGILKATGDWIYFLGADDTLYADDVLENIFSRTDVDQFDIIYGNVWMPDSKKKFNGVYNIPKILSENICHQAIFYHKSIFDRFGVYDLKYPILSDHAFNLQWFADNTIRVRYVNTIIAQYAETGMSGTKADIQFKKDRGKLALKNFGFFWYLYAALVVPWIHFLRKVKRK